MGNSFLPSLKWSSGGIFCVPGSFDRTSMKTSSKSRNAMRPSSLCCTPIIVSSSRIAGMSLLLGGMSRGTITTSSLTKGL